MTVDWTLFFPSGTRVLALPSWRSPRLYLPAQRRQRWEASSFYPAFRLGARIYRFLLRTRATAGLVETRTSRSDRWPLGDFARDVLPGVVSAVVLMGTPGPAQNITAQLRDGEGHILGYLKYAEKEAARRRLKRERLMLANLPDDAGPELLKYAAFDTGEALLTAPQPGKTMPADLPPERGVASFLSSLVTHPPVPLAAHPWVERMRERGEPSLDRWLEALAARDWPVVMQHGDFAPWNLIQRPGGGMCAIDWDHGVMEGFPHLDLAYFVLQTSALVYRWSPFRAAEYASGYLSQQPQLGLSEAEARALVRLAAREAHFEFQEDGHSPGEPLQRWRQAAWEGLA